MGGATVRNRDRWSLILKVAPPQRQCWEMQQEQQYGTASNDNPLVNFIEHVPEPDETAPASRGEVTSISDVNILARCDEFRFRPVGWASETQLESTSFNKADYVTAEDQRKVLYTRVP